MLSSRSGNSTGRPSCAASRSAASRSSSRSVVATIRRVRCRERTPKSVGSYAMPVTGTPERPRLRASASPAQSRPKTTAGR